MVVEQDRPLRVLALSRLFGGLKSGLAAEKWEPAGVPAIYRLLEALAADRNVDLLSVFAAKETDARFDRVRKLDLPRIGKTILLPYRDWFSARLHRINMGLTELEMAARVLMIAAKFRPHIIYATYANILPAALLARLGHRGVVLRFMGVMPHHREIAEGGLPLFRWQLRSPFAQVICTEDGSDPGALLPKLLHAQTPILVRLNGCDAPTMSESDIRSFRAEQNLGERPAVVFVGRLESYKGALDFVDAALLALKTCPDCADFVLVGDGPLRAEMETRVAAAKQLSRVRFVGAQRHADVGRFVGAADVYVSTNMYGNLSNANLEALAVGACIMMPSSDATIPIDTVTDTLIPNDVASRFDRHRMPLSLTEVLLRLLSSPEEIARRRSSAKALAKRLLRPWAQSAAEDVGLLRVIRQVPHCSGNVQARIGPSSHGR